ncbi:hypothetical protein F511_19003 [Dorcoceras hygrometricum]|uniref:Uncharacterized protein n=1 Tax=Dorcoceras hygrometricum TaxID=472368 RepID=A0A2Z7CBY3_9LAMI|nr:hypothetical protein F511_19003 [Dorcoceras hygrometricum]
MHEEQGTAEGYSHSREPKNSGIDQQLTTDYAKIVITVCVQAYGNYPLISTPHPIPDASQLLNLLLPNSRTVGPRNVYPPPAKPTQANNQGQKHRKATAGSYELNQRYPTSSNSAESSKQHETGSEHLPQQARTEMLTDYTREMSSHTSPSSSKRPKSISSEASQQEESHATTLTSIGVVYRRQSKKISVGNNPSSSKRPKSISSEASQQEESHATTLTSIGVVYRRQSKKISEDIYQQTTLLYRESFLPTDIETVQEMFVFGTVRVTFAINRFGNSKFNATSFAITDMMTSATVEISDIMTSPSDLATMVI